MRQITRMNGKFNDILYTPTLVSCLDNFGFFAVDSMPDDFVS